MFGIYNSSPAIASSPFYSFSPVLVLFTRILPVMPAFRMLLSALAPLLPTLLVYCCFLLCGNGCCSCDHSCHSTFTHLPSVFLVCLFHSLAQSVLDWCAAVPSWCPPPISFIPLNLSDPCHSASQW